MQGRSWQLDHARAAGVLCRHAAAFDAPRAPRAARCREQQLNPKIAPITRHDAFGLKLERPEERQLARPSKTPPSALIATSIPASAMMLTNGACQLASLHATPYAASRAPGSRTLSLPRLTTHSLNPKHPSRRRSDPARPRPRTPRRFCSTSMRSATPSLPTTKPRPRSASPRLRPRTRACAA